jgi:PTS system ascorbate-specific IIC component
MVMLAGVTYVWNLLFNNILSQPAIFIGLIVVTGYILLKRKWYEVVAGFIRTVVGYMILQAGAGLLKGTVSPLLDGVSKKWSIDAVVIDPNFGFTAANNALESIGITTSFAMITSLLSGILHLCSLGSILRSGLCLRLVILW